jgi:hypothetical protein
MKRRVKKGSDYFVPVHFNEDFRAQGGHGSELVGNIN